jgi:hypothetical protein
LHHLTALGVRVSYRVGSMDELCAHLRDARPCVALVNTNDLSYWNYGTDHALVVVGYGDQTIFVNDPAFDTHPIAIGMAEFELSWMAFDYRYGCLTIA